MRFRLIFIITAVAFLFLVFCDNSISGNQEESFSEKDFIGKWFYGDTCLLWESIIYTFTDSTCIKETTSIGANERLMTSDDTILFQNWYVKNDSLFLLFDEANLNNPKNERYQFSFISNGNFLLCLGNTLWIEFSRDNHFFMNY